MPRETANITLQYDDEDFREEPIAEQERPLVSPPLAEFHAAIDPCYEKISYHATLSNQALKELQALIESLLIKEAQQNVSRLERDGEHDTKELIPTQESDRTIVAKKGWVDKMMACKGRGKRKGQDDSKKDKDHIEQLKKQVTGANAPEKLEMKKKDSYYHSKVNLTSKLWKLWN
ncbi:unnamed protein product [Calypogeia fissa]